MGFLTSILDACIRNLDWGLRVTIAVIFFGLTILFLRLSIKSKGAKTPLAIGYYILTFISLFLFVLYLAV